MSDRGIARRYAAALFDVVVKDGDLTRARTELEGLSSVITGHDELTKVLGSPTISAQKKQGLVGALLDVVGGISDPVRRLILLLAEHDRLGTLADVSVLFAERVMEASRVMPAEVVTAVPLGPADREALAGALGRATDSKVTLSERVDPSIVGGVVARVGSVVFDGSLTRQIERLRRKLLAEV